MDNEDIDYKVCLLYRPIKNGSYWNHCSTSLHALNKRSCESFSISHLVSWETMSSQLQFELKGSVGLCPELQHATRMRNNGPTGEFSSQSLMWGHPTFKSARGFVLEKKMTLGQHICPLHHTAAEVVLAAPPLPANILHHTLPGSEWQPANFLLYRKKHCYLSASDSLALPWGGTRALERLKKKKDGGMEAEVEGWGRGGGVEKERS